MITFDKDIYYLGWGKYLSNNSDTETNVTIDFHGDNFDNYSVTSSDERIFSVEKSQDQSSLGHVVIIAFKAGEGKLTVNNNGETHSVPVTVIERRIRISDAVKDNIMVTHNIPITIDSTLTDTGYKNPQWSIEAGTQLATIDNSGELHPTIDGDIKIKITAEYNGIKFSHIDDFKIQPQYSSAPDLKILYFYEPYQRLIPELIPFTNGNSVTLNVNQNKSYYIYQWYKNDRPYGGNSPVLSLDNMTSSDAGTYYCAVTNNAGTTNTTNCIVEYHTSLNYPS
jgi:hypothetical protein